MIPYPSVLVFITLCFPLLTRADSQVVQHLGEPPVVTFGSDTYAECTELASLFNPFNIVDSIQGSLPVSLPEPIVETVQGRFVSNILGIPSAANLGNVEPEAEPSPDSSDDWFELRPPNLEALLSEEVGKIVWPFETVVNSVIALGVALYDVLRSGSPESDLSSHVPLNALLKKVASLLAIARDDFQEKFPLPAAAPGHAERVESVSERLDDFQRLVVRLVWNHEVDGGMVERHLARVKPWLHDVCVFLGDVAELYPAATEALVLNLTAVLLPEAVFLRALVILYCFGPYVLGRDAISGWLSKHVTEALRI